MNRCGIRSLKLNRLSAIALLLAALPVLFQPGAHAQFNDERWRSDFPQAMTADEISGAPLVAARARWNAMTTAQRAELMAGQRRAMVRGGKFVPPPPEPEGAEGEQGGGSCCRV